MKLNILFASLILSAMAEDRSEGEDCVKDVDNCDFNNGECCHVTGKDLTTLERTMCVNNKKITVKESEEPEETYGINCYYRF